jgi:hypothetical protein
VHIGTGRNRHVRRMSGNPEAPKNRKTAFHEKQLDSYSPVGFDCFFFLGKQNPTIKSLLLF